MFPNLYFEINPLFNTKYIELIGENGWNNPHIYKFNPFYVFVWKVTHFFYINILDYRKYLHVYYKRNYYFYKKKKN